MRVVNNTGIDAHAYSVIRDVLGQLAIGESLDVPDEDEEIILEPV